ncbi:MAG TPA: hypothetical protein VMH03_04950 [Terriglobales bacterium]|nr:hypothetical protein [Terriglobales bacterium]
MRHLRHLVLLSLLILPAVSAHAGVAVGVGVGVAPGYIGPAPVCAYGYYPYYPYACAPLGYYGPQWFVGGVFIGAGPWYRGYYGHSFYRGPYYGGWYGRGWYGPHALPHAGYGYNSRAVPVYRGPVAHAQLGNGFRGGAGGFRGSGRR